MGGKTSQKKLAHETETTNRLQLLLSSQGRGQKRHPAWAGGFPRGKNKRQGASHLNMLMVSSETLLLAMLTH